jgi:excisionase family DNA binding protein
MADHDLMTDKDVAVLLKKGVRTVRRLRASGLLAYLPGKPVLIPRGALDDYLRRTVRLSKPAGRLPLRAPRLPIPTRK